MNGFGRNFFCSFIFTRPHWFLPVQMTGRRFSAQSYATAPLVYPEGHCHGYKYKFVGGSDL